MVTSRTAAAGTLGARSGKTSSGLTATPGRPGDAGHSPLLVLSPRSFNERTSLVIGLPMTTAEYNADNPFAVVAGQPSQAKPATLLPPAQVV